MCVCPTGGSRTQKFTRGPLFPGCVFFSFLKQVSGRPDRPVVRRWIIAHFYVSVRFPGLLLDGWPTQCCGFKKMKRILIVIRAVEIYPQAKKLGKKPYYQVLIACECVCPCLYVCVCRCVCVWVLRCLQDAQRRTSSLKSFGYNKVKRAMQVKETERERQKRTRENNIHKGRARSAQCGKQSLNCDSDSPSLSSPSGGGRRKKGREVFV